MTALYVVLGLVVLLLLAVVVSYNRFVRQRNLVKESWTQIDVELRRRHDLIPNLVETVKGYAAHERTVLQNVVEARTAAVSAGGGVAAQAKAEAQPGRAAGSRRRPRPSRSWPGRCAACSRSRRTTPTSRRPGHSCSCRRSSPRPR